MPRTGPMAIRIDARVVTPKGSYELERSYALGSSLTDAGAALADLAQLLDGPGAVGASITLTKIRLTDAE